MTMKNKKAAPSEDVQHGLEQLKPELKPHKFKMKDDTLLLEITAKDTVPPELLKCFGSHDLDATHRLVKQILGVIPGLTQETIADRLNEITPLLHGIGPKDELEGMLAIQMVGIHNMAMEMMSRAMISDQTVDGVNFNVNRVNKLTRTFVAQMEALDKHRGKGQQKITVEHVTVNEGGQAIVGNVEQRRAGGQG